MPATVLKVTLAGEDLGVFDFQKFSVSDGYLVKGTFGLNGKQFLDGIPDLDPAALQAFVWLLRRKQGQTSLDPRSIDFAIADLDIEDLPDPTSETSGSDAAGTSVS